MRQISLLYEEPADIRAAQESIPQIGTDFETTSMFLSRRIAHLPAQLDGTLRELIVVVQTLRELNTVAVRITGNLTQRSPPIAAQTEVPPLLARPPLVDSARTRAFEQQAEVQPTRQVRPPMPTSKSASNLREQHPAYRTDVGTRMEVTNVLN